MAIEHFCFCFCASPVGKERPLCIKRKTSMINPNSSSFWKLKAYLLKNVLSFSEWIISKFIIFQIWEWYINDINFFQLSYVFCQYPYFVCPLEYSEAEESLKYECDPSPVFRPQEYALPETVANFSALVSEEKKILMHGMHWKFERRTLYFLECHLIFVEGKYIKI